MLYGWKENSMLTNCFAAYAHLPITVCEIERDSCEKNLNFIIPLALDAPVRGFPSECRHSLWYGKTRMVSLPGGAKFSKICLFVLTWSTNVTDGRTDRRTDRQTLRDSIDRACIVSRGKKLKQCSRVICINRNGEKHTKWHLMQSKMQFFCSDA